MSDFQDFHKQSWKFRQKTRSYWYCGCRSPDVIRPLYTALVVMSKLPVRLKGWKTFPWHLSQNSNANIISKDTGHFLLQSQAFSNAQVSNSETISITKLKQNDYRLTNFPCYLVK